MPPGGGRPAVFAHGVRKGDVATVLLYVAQQFHRALSPDRPVPQQPADDALPRHVTQRLAVRDADKEFEVERAGLLARLAGWSETEALMERVRTAAAADDEFV